MVLLKVDKGQHDIGFICKSFYLSLLSKQLGGPAYQQLKATEEVTLAFLAENNKILGNKHADRLPHLYGMIKLHKSAIGMRWISGASSLTGTEKQRQLDKEHKTAPLTPIN